MQIGGRNKMKFIREIKTIKPIEDKNKKQRESQRVEKPIPKPKLSLEESFRRKFLVAQKF